MPPNPIDTAPRFDPIERTSLALSAGAVAATWWLASPAFAVGLAVGAALEAVNFRGLRRQAQLLFQGEMQSSGGWVGVYGMRFGILALGITTALLLGAHPVGLALGLSLIMPAAVLEAWRARPPVDPDAPALESDDPAWERWNPWLAREDPEPTGDDDA